MHRRRRDIQLLTIGLLLLAFGGVIVFFHENRQSVAVDRSHVSHASTVTLTNSSEYPQQLASSDLLSTENALYDQVRRYVQQPSRSYIGTIRSDTVTVTSNAYGATTPPTQIPTVSYLVDIPALKQTYRVSYSGGPAYPYNILYVLCPSAQELKYGSFGCKNED